MTFEETLQAMLGLLGEHVSVSIGVRAGSQPLVGAWAGTLDVGTELRPAGSTLSEDAFYFCFREDRANGFFLHEEAFSGAQWVPQGAGHDSFLEIDSGPLRITIDRELSPNRT